MKRIIGIGLNALVIVISITVSHAQSTKIDDQRMTRDIEVAENVLNTLIKQQYEKRMYFPMNVEGEYMAGYGVTFRLPADYYVMGFDMPKLMLDAPAGFSYSYNISSDGPQGVSHIDADVAEVKRDKAKAEGEQRAKDQSAKAQSERLRTLQVSRATNANDSTRDLYNLRVIEASKTFLADYGDLISQLNADEKILITNQGEGRSMFMGNVSKRTHISIEATKGDLTQYRQGKLTREQLMTKIHVVNSETSDELDPDLELLSSIFSRLYQQDLSKTFFTQRDIYYERLNEFGVIYYMQVYSSNQNNTGTYKNYAMPTVRMNDVDQKTRDAKVKELYPVFEKDIKENILDYGRTLKSLKDEESVVVNVQLTKCEACGIPSSIELSVKESVLKDYNTGKLTKDAALAKINIKKGVTQ